MELFDFQIVKRKTNKNLPYIDDKERLIIPNANKAYKYYLETVRYNPEAEDYERYILFGNKPFNENCERCTIDNYGRIKLFLSKEFKHYLVKEIANGNNIDLQYVETRDEFDVWEIV